MTSLTPLGLTTPGLTLDRPTRRQLDAIRRDEQVQRAAAKALGRTEHTRLQAATTLATHGMAALVLLTEYQRLYEGLSPLAVGRVSSVADISAIHLARMVADGIERLSQ